MNGRRITDAQISEALRAHLPDRAYPGLRERILDAAETTGQQPALPSFLGALSDADPVVRRRSLLIAAALLVALALASAAAVGALRLLQRDPVRDLTVKPRPSPSASTALLAPSPSAPTALLTWSRASLDVDWPAPVRVEPDGIPTVAPILLKTVVKGTNCPGDCSYSSTWGHFVDPSGDTGSDAFPWADIREVTFCGSACLKIGFVSDPPPAVDPSQQWIAYGVVADTDGDGVPDWRYGIDNEPVDTPGAYGSSPRRWWRTDLHTGRTESAVGDHVSLPSGQMFYGNHGNQSGGSGLQFGGDTTGGLVLGLPKRFYVWASVIQDGRVVATDYAPDVGWLVPSPDAKP
jgi:hypothetical protein